MELGPSSISSLSLGGNSAIGDSVWNAWILSGFREALPNTSLFCTTTGLGRYVIDEQLASTSDSSHSAVPAELNLYCSDSDGVERIFQKLQLPRLEFFRTMDVHSLDDLNQVRETGYPHPLDAWTHAIRQEMPEFTLPNQPQMPNLQKEKAMVSKDIGRITRPLISINTGASTLIKEYPIARQMHLAKLLVKAGCSVLFIGSDVNPKPSRFFTSVHRHIIDRVGCWDLRTSMAAIQISDVHVAADTGTGHIAGALGIPGVTLLGKRSFLEATEPRGSRREVLESDTSHVDIPPENIRDAVLELLEER